MDFLVELQRETGIILIWNTFASNHGGGAADADVNDVQMFLKNYVKNNDTSLKGNFVLLQIPTEIMLIMEDKSSKIKELINKIKNHQAEGINSSISKKYSDVKLDKMKGIDSKHCFSVTESFVIGNLSFLSL